MCCNFPKQSKVYIPKLVGITIARWDFFLQKFSFPVVSILVFLRKRTICDTFGSLKDQQRQDLGPCTLKKILISEKNVCSLDLPLQELGCSPPPTLHPIAESVPGIRCPQNPSRGHARKSGFTAPGADSGTQRPRSHRLLDGFWGHLIPGAEVFAPGSVAGSVGSGGRPSGSVPGSAELKFLGVLAGSRPCHCGADVSESLGSVPAESGGMFLGASPGSVPETVEPGRAFPTELLRRATRRTISADRTSAPPGLLLFARLKCWVCRRVARQ